MTLPSRQSVTLEEVRALYDLPLTELVFRAQSVHRQHHAPDSVQLCTLLSIKTGGCPENCGYCSQSARHEKKIEAEPLMDEESVLAAARRALGRQIPARLCYYVARGRLSDRGR